MKNILYFQSPWHHWRARLGGIFRYAAKAGWQVHVVESGLTDLPTRKALGFWNPDGCIVASSIVDRPDFNQADFGSLPVVYCDVDPGLFGGNIANVVNDSPETAEIAAGELFSLGLRHFAFVGNIIPRNWSRLRRETLAAAVERESAASCCGESGAGYTFDSFEPDSPDSIEVFFARIRPWLRSLPKPCGIMAANDISGDLVLQALRMERIRVPEDVAVVGVDDDDLVCAHTVPTLTSVRPDFEQSGWLAAKLLDDLASGRATVPCTVRFGPTGVVRRNSTCKFARRDNGVLRALDEIRSRACAGVTPAEICALIGGSRRRAETRFRMIAGRSVGEEIRAVRVERAQALLLRAEKAVETIYLDCGYGDSSSLRRAFKAVTGLSPRQWRASHRARK